MSITGSFFPGLFSIMMSQVYQKEKKNSNDIMKAKNFKFIFTLTQDLCYRKSSASPL